MKKEKILGFDVCTYNKKELLENIFEDYKNNEKLFIVNVNPEIAVSNYKNNEKKEIFNKQKYQIPDGAGIVWASKKHKGDIKERITGIDLMLDICAKSCEYSSKIYLYGTTQEIIENAKNELEKQFNKINIVGAYNGFDDEKVVIEDINKKQPDILFIGLGSPKQEDFIIKNMNILKSVNIFMPVGGSFDVISKFKKRAPEWIQKINMEWLYRIIIQPKRILRSFRLVKFIYVLWSTKEKN